MAAVGLDLSRAEAPQRSANRILAEYARDTDDALVLAHAHRWPELTANDGNIALLKLAAKLGLIPGDSADAVADAYREFRRRQHRQRLNGAKYARVPAAEVQTHIDATQALWRRVFGGE